MNILHLVFASIYYTFSWVTIAVLKDQVLEKHELFFFNFCGRSAVARFFLYYEWFRCNCWDIEERQEKSIFSSHLKLSVGEWISIITRDLDEIWVFMDPLFNFCGSQCSLKQLIRSHYGWHKLPDADKNGNTLKCKYNTVIEWKWCECMPMYLMNPHII